VRRPPLSAWAVNQLVRERTPVLHDLWKAGDQLQEPHGGKGDFRAALDAEREALDALVASAAELVERTGHIAADATLVRVRGTLQAAAAADRDARRAVEEGKLRARPPAARLRGAGLNPGFTQPVEQRAKPALSREGRATIVRSPPPAASHRGRRLPPDRASLRLEDASALKRARDRRLPHPPSCSKPWRQLG
jgi:hypothetical protein